LCELGDVLEGRNRVCLEMHMEVEIKLNPEMHLEAESKLNSEMHLDAVIEQVWGYTWRPRSC
jgi:hypothetical protein